ncbi:MAG: response regulator [Eubacteriales bacterium]|nr:response regulator [Eubacteriales bacterium]
MLRVFLVEDESVIRETLRDTMPWARCGYTFVGEASDGEMALPLIRKARPDVIITDIRMPFMDGLAMSRLVLEELPEVKIIIISGYDDFEYARQAIRIGVEQYLLKPVTKASLMNVLREVREKIEQERAQQSYQAQFQQDSQEYEQYARHSFMERVVAGRLSVQQIYEEAGKLGLDLRAQSYCLALFSVLGETYSESDAQVREALLGHFMKHPEYLLLRWNLTTYMVLLKGDADKMEGYLQRCTAAVQSCYSGLDQEQKWYLAVGKPTRRLSALPGCFEEVSRLWAYRYIQPQSHILTAETVGAVPENQPEASLSRLDVAKFNPTILLGVMQNATVEEIPSFVGEFLHGVQEALRSKPFCQYLMLSARFTATEYVQSLGVSQEELLAGLEHLDMVGRPVGEGDLGRYLVEMLIRAVKLRDRSSTNQYRDLLGQAVAYIDSHYADERLSLNQVAREVNISANYLSAVFSQEMECTFIEYVTGKRMARARELLRTTDKRSGEVAMEVGYKDPHYFSFLFKKTHGCTPRDYRAGGKR